MFILSRNYIPITMHLVFILTPVCQSTKCAINTPSELMQNCFVKG